MFFRRGEIVTIDGGTVRYNVDHLREEYRNKELVQVADLSDVEGRSRPGIAVDRLTKSSRLMPATQSRPHDHGKVLGTSGQLVSESLDRLSGFTPEPWTQDALCAQTDPDAFFPEKGGSTRDAKTICRECDVTEDCLLYALRNDERFGIWGGLSERERRKLKRGGRRTSITNGAVRIGGRS